MEDFIFNTAEASEIKSLDFEPTLFHFPTHLNLQRVNGWKWYYALHPKRKKVVASLYLNVDREIASSSIQSPFGTIECADDLPPEVLYRFLDFVETKVRQLAVRRIILKNPPLHYNLKRGALLHAFLFNRGYEVTTAEVGGIRFVEDEYIRELNRLERRKLRLCHSANLTSRLLSHECKYEVHSFLRACRERKGYTLSMTFEDLEKSINQFPDRYLLFGVFNRDEMIAASVAVRISSSILYCFYAGHSETYDKWSPVVFLVESLYNYCQQQGISMLDFGTSAVNGQPNFGLLNFKLRLGGRPSPKLTFEKTLTP